jgi:S1-C subfamily serine protease
MLPSMLRGLPWSPMCRAAAILVLGLGACRLAPSEAAAPEASAWPDDDAARLGIEADPPPPLAAAPAEPAEPSPPPLRPRPPGAIFRDELQRATGPGPAYLLRQLGPEPFRHDGHFIGWEITQLFPDDPELCAPGCDLAIGDVILGVNGHRLQTPQDLSDAFEALPGWTRLDVQSLRDGQRRHVTYTVLDDPA